MEREIKVGDKVKIIKDNGAHYPPIIIGDICTITNIKVIKDKEYFYTDKENVLDLDEFELIDSRPELKSGMVIETREGKLYLLINWYDKTLLATELGTEYYFTDVKYDYDNEFIKDLEIVKIYEVNPCDMFDKKLKNDYIPIWTRKDEILNETEKEYLSNLFKPFRDRVASVKKCKCDEVRYFLSIYMKKEIGFTLPYNDIDTFKGMELDKSYTLDELGL